MKKKKRLAVMILCLAMIFGLMPANTYSVNAASKANWYKTVLNKKNQTYSVRKLYEGSPKFKIKRKQFKYYNAVDINRDGSKELFLSTTASEFIPYNDRVLLLTYYKGKIIPLGLAETASGSAFSYKGRYLSFYSRGAGQSQYDVYKVSKGKLKKIVSLEYDNYTVKNGKLVMTYRKNDKECSRKTYQKYYKKYVNGGKKISYQKIKK